MIKNSKFKYFTRLELENIKCFGTKQSLDLSDGNGNPTRWNLILGDNGVGKTTVLQCLDWMRPEPANDAAELITKVENETDINYVRLNRRIEAPKKSDGRDNGDKKDSNVITLVPALQNVDDNRFFRLLPKSTQTNLHLVAEISHGKKLVDTHPLTEDSRQINKNSKRESSETETIITGVNITFEKNGDLKDYTSEGNVEIENKENVVDNYKLPFIVVYSANRYLGKENKEESRLKDSGFSSLTENTELYDAEQILKDLEYAVLKFGTERDIKYFEDVKQMITRVLNLNSPEDIHINPTKRIENSPNPDGVSFTTFSGEVGISELSLGYQTTLAWTLDLAWRLYENYPNQNDPLKEPAIVVIDELDLHLHPEWQRRIMDDLTFVFPQVQFVATSHSPLLVQSKPNANFAVIKKIENEVVIENDPELVKGWRIDQILNSEYFGVRISRPPETEKLFEKRDKLLLKFSRSFKEEKELQGLQREISMLRTETNPEEDEAIIYLQKAAELLKREGSNKDDKDK